MSADRRRRARATRAAPAARDAVASAGDDVTAATARGAALGRPGRGRCARRCSARSTADGRQFLTVSLPAILRELAPVRTAGAHRGMVERAVARALRDRHLGGGGLGVLAELGRVRARG
jgi:hypothetical protein